MRMILITAALCCLFSITKGFIPGFKLPILPGAICKKNACKTSEDCKGKLNFCSKFPLCRNMVCIAKPKVTTTTTTTTPTTKPTTKPKPKYPCPYPLENELARLDCKRGPKKNTICTVSCKVGQCHVGSTITRCGCQGAECKWTRDIDSFCRKKMDKDPCQNGGGCKPGYSCVPVGCSKICKKVCEDSCKTNANCPPGNACRTTSCGKKCKPSVPQCPKPCVKGSCSIGYTCQSARPPCKSECVIIKVPQCPKPCVKGSCSIGYTCQSARPPCKRSECVKIKVLPCQRPCKLGDDKSCPAGYMCVAAASPCVSNCVRKTDLPKCPLFYPSSRMPRNVTEFCNTEPLSCKSDLDCGSDAVCCNSALCKRMMCSKKENKCPLKLTKRCTTNKDCENAEDVCAYNIAAEGCKTCTKGFRCQPYAKSCGEDTDCTTPLKCMAGENGCLSCKSALPTNPQPPSTCPHVQCRSSLDCRIGQRCLTYRIGCKRCQEIDNNPTLPPPPSPCVWHHCSSDNDCPLGRKCKPDALGCKKCQLSFDEVPSPSCEGQKCSTNTQCKSGKCVTRARNCKVCLPALQPTDCDIKKMCITNSNCKEGEICLIKGPGCRICVVKKTL